MFSMLVFRSLTVRGSRIGIALGAILVGAAVVSALTSLYFDISIKMSEELRAFGANVIVTPRSAGQTGGEGTHGIAAETLRAAIGALPQGKIVGASPFLYGVVRLDVANAVLAGVDFQGLRAISPYWQVEGSWVTADFDDRNVMVGRRIAQTMQMKIGSPVTIINRDRTHQVQVRVKGIVDTGGAEDDQVFVNLPLAQRLLDRPDQADLAMLSVIARGGEADALAADLARRFPDIEVRPIRKVSQADGKILDKIEGLMALVATVVLIITILCVNATLTAMVAARTPQIGLQKAIGAGNGSIVAQFMAETTVICVVAVALGLGVGFALAQVLGQAVFGAWVTFRPVVVPLTFGLSFAAALIAAVLPVRGAVRIVPARVLKGE
ncbi:ABC transporter permease [Telmatospirillum siberiense]|uniref:ABC transporter permease n=2 Tax=Telmatospirillum siberiense TaxID=382514 RepID=A0A2N3PM22_9PROT|nr:ABC transporter permease [Telmatospirillum siberiense]